MSAVAVVRYLLTQAAAVTAIIPASRIVAGDLPLNFTLPAISVMEISSNPRNTVAMNGANVLHTERVQVSVLFKGPQGTPAGTGLPGVKGVLALLLAAVPHTHGTVNGFDVLSILPDQEGPDLQDVATSLYSGSRDFIVKYRS
ncbi:MAG: hypothetical protein NUV75_01950 [Gallionella sp.]|nr:hypothetical protein [Gallionella sp.]